MRRYPLLSDELAHQLRAVPVSHDGPMLYAPCAVTLHDGSVLPCVYIVDQNAYIRAWGVYPADDRAKQEVFLETVARIDESPHRLPAPLADELYRAGESGMGYTVFTVEFRDGSERAYITGNAVDFIDPPPGLSASDAVRVRPHDGRSNAKTDSLRYAWCLYDGSERAG